MSDLAMEKVFKEHWTSKLKLDSRFLGKIP